MFYIWFSFIYYLVHFHLSLWCVYSTPVSTAILEYIKVILDKIISSFYINKFVNVKLWLCVGVFFHIPFLSHVYVCSESSFYFRYSMAHKRWISLKTKHIVTYNSQHVVSNRIIHSLMIKKRNITVFIPRRNMFLVYVWLKLLQHFTLAFNVYMFYT